MAQDLNMVGLVGRLTRDPELRHTASGTAVANLRVAHTTRRRGADGEWTDKSNYIDVVVFAGMADNAAKYLTKGRRIGVQGRLEWSEWESADGSKRQKNEIVAENLQYLDSPNGNGNEAGGMPIAPASADDSTGPDDTPF